MPVLVFGVFRLFNLFLSRQCNKASGQVGKAWTKSKACRHRVAVFQCGFNISHTTCHIQGFSQQSFFSILIRLCCRLLVISVFIITTQSLFCYPIFIKRIKSRFKASPAINISRTFRIEFTGIVIQKCLTQIELLAPIIQAHHIFKDGCNGKCKTRSLRTLILDFTEISTKIKTVNMNFVSLIGLL